MDDTERAQAKFDYIASPGACAFCTRPAEGDSILYVEFFAGQHALVVADRHVRFRHPAAALLCLRVCESCRDGYLEAAAAGEAERILHEERS